MRWSPEQDGALVAVQRWLEQGDEQVFRLFGYAGTGKTTLARHLAEGVDGQVLFAAFTGKAAHVLRSKGCDGASTIHSLIYRSKDKSRARLRELEQQLEEEKEALRRELVPENELISRPSVRSIARDIAAEKENLEKPLWSLNLESELRDASLCIIDECSMVDRRMGADLLSFGAKILVLGDPAQLPPIAGAGYFTEGEPDIMLTEIHRQAQDSPIIRLATMVRKREHVPLGELGGGCRVVRELDGDAQVDQILVGTNRSRRYWNETTRESLGFRPAMPVPGDRVVCLRNNHELGLLNGAIWDVSHVGAMEGDAVNLVVVPEEGGPPLGVMAHMAHFRDEKLDLSFYERAEAEEFAFGYALTVHKAQGSQWDDVVLFDESDVFREQKHRWLYTGITRAARSLVLVRER